MQKNEQLQNFCVMFIDDDPMLLAGVRRQLVRKLESCELMFFDCPNKAISEFESKRIDVVFSDIQMPRMNGVEFLSRVSELSPNTLRFAWSGGLESTEDSALLRATGFVLAKPCPTPRLVDLIRQLESHAKFPPRDDGESHLNNLLKSFDDIVTSLA